jgi:hypothetical protein
MAFAYRHMNFLQTNTEISVHGDSRNTRPVDAYVTVLGKANNNQLLQLQQESERKCR